MTTERRPQQGQLLTGLLRAVVRGVLRPMLTPRVPLSLQRRFVDAAARIGRTPAGMHCTPQKLGGVDCERVDFDGAASPARAMLYLHGGGYCIGSARTYRGLACWLAHGNRMPVYLADYRLAPEHPFPAAVDDAFAVYRALQEQGLRRIVVAGDSAGGGLSLALAQRIAEAGLTAPAALLLLSPWVDLDAEQAACMRDPKARDALLTAAGLRAWAGAYLGAELAGNPRHPLCSPLYADLQGLPPTLIQGGGDELMLPEFHLLAEQMEAAGVDVELDIEPALWHVYPVHAGMLPASDRALERVSGFLGRVLADEPAGTADTVAGTCAEGA